MFNSNTNICAKGKKYCSHGVAQRHSRNSGCFSDCCIKDECKVFGIRALKNRPMQSPGRFTTEQQNRLVCQIARRNPNVSYPELKQHLEATDMFQWKPIKNTSCLRVVQQKIVKVNELCRQNGYVYKI